MIFTRVDARPRRSTSWQGLVGAASPLVGASLRFRVQPRDVPREAVARRLGLTLARFDVSFANLVARGFPAPDPDTGNFDLQAVDRWCDARHPHLFGTTGVIMQARDASTVARDRIAKMKAGAGGG